MIVYSRYALPLSFFRLDFATEAKLFELHLDMNRNRYKPAMRLGEVTNAMGWKPSTSTRAYASDLYPLRRRFSTSHMNAAPMTTPQSTPPPTWAATTPHG
jgi:hypothetical protein